MLAPALGTAVWVSTCHDAPGPQGPPSTKKGLFMDCSKINMIGPYCNIFLIGPAA